VRPVPRRLLVSAQWVAANKQLTEEVGAQAWLEKLLAVLQGDYPLSPDDDFTLGHMHH